jgi:hypothetical protein
MNLYPLYLGCSIWPNFFQGLVCLHEARQIESVAAVEDRRRLSVELATNESEAESVLGVSGAVVSLKLEPWGKDECDTSGESVLVDLVSELGWEAEKRRFQRVALSSGMKSI